MSRHHSSEYKLLLPAKKNKRERSGVRERGWKIISEEQMRKGEAYFWGKRGFAEPPGATSAGVIY